MKPKLCFSTLKGSVRTRGSIPKLTMFTKITHNALKQEALILMLQLFKNKLLKKMGGMRIPQRFLFYLSKDMTSQWPAIAQQIRAVSEGPWAYDWLFIAHRWPDWLDKERLSEEKVTVLLVQSETRVRATEKEACCIIPAESQAQGRNIPFNAMSLSLCVCILPLL